MQLLRGMSITLYTASGTETVQNVLVGEPSGSGYTLGIPKGDAHDWTDRKIGFFGRIWRTVGLPMQGIPENIPLCWGINVKVQEMPVSGAVTVYEAETYTRHLIGSVQITGVRGQRTDKTGVQHDGALSVRIYAPCRPDYIPRAGDILVPGECPVTFGSTEQAVSAAMAQLRSYDYAVIRSVSTETVGRDPDYILTAG